MSKEKGKTLWEDIKDSAKKPFKPRKKKSKNSSKNDIIELCSKIPGYFTNQDWICLGIKNQDQIDLTGLDWQNPDRIGTGSQNPDRMDWIEKTHIWSVKVEEL